MESKALKELIKEVSRDAKSKMEFLTNPGGFLKKHNLTEEEERAVLSTHARLKLATNSFELEAEPMGIWNSPTPLAKETGPTGIWNSPTP
jgi:hypothetical protein